MTKLGQGTKRGFTSLRFSSDFSKVKASAEKFQTYNFVVWKMPEENLQKKKTRLGLTVSTKIDKRAVIRNRIKRLIRSAFTEIIKSKKISGHFIIMARKNCSELSSIQVTKELLKVIK